jgi:hypothetical protein
MDANEMAYQFDILYDKISSESSPGYTNREKSVFLTKAQTVFIDRYQSHEYASKRARDLDNIKVTVSLTTPSSTQDVGKPFGVRYNLPNDFLYSMSEEVVIASSNECLDGNRVRVVPKREDEYAIQIHNPFKKPSIVGSAGDLIWRMVYRDYVDTTNNNAVTKRVDLITDGVATISEYILTYLKTPVDVVPVLLSDSSTTTQSDCELNPSCHPDIVEIAVRIATGVTTPQDYQLKLNEEKINN